jgi:hypothetical protein
MCRLSNFRVGFLAPNDICGWAYHTDRPARALVAWAKKHRRGGYRRCRRTATGRSRTNRRDHGRESDSPAAREVAPERQGDLLRDIHADPETLARVAERLGV